MAGVTEAGLDPVAQAGGPRSEVVAWAECCGPLIAREWGYAWLGADPPALAASCLKYKVALTSVE